MKTPRSSSSVFLNPRNSSPKRLAYEYELTKTPANFGPGFFVETLNARIGRSVVILLGLFGDLEFRRTLSARQGE